MPRGILQQAVRALALARLPSVRHLGARERLLRELRLTGLGTMYFGQDDGPRPGSGPTAAPPAQPPAPATPENDDPSST